MDTKEYWHRFEDYKVSHHDDDYNHTWTSTHVRYRKMQVIKKTPKGVWLKAYALFNDKKFVLLKARKRWACPTIEEAEESFIARKTKQAAIYQARVDRAKLSIQLVKNKRYDHVSI